LRVKSAVLSCLEAFLDAGLDKGLVPPERIALVVGGNNLGQQSMARSLRRLAGDLDMANPRYALQFMDTDHVGTLSAILQIRGEGFTVGGASASGNVAIVKGRQLLLGDHADVCIVVGGMMELSSLEMAAFANLGALGGKRFHDEPERACRPFDRDRDGFVYGQATAAMVLAKTGVCSHFKPSAAITGASLVLDANQLSDPSAEGEQRAMWTALGEAGVDLRAVDYINAHGTASVIGDQTELEALRGVFGDRLREIRVNSTKSLTGHCLTAAGLIEAVASVIQMRCGFVHPNRNLERPIDDTIHFAGARSEPCSLSTCLSNSFGFGGINSSIVMQTIDPRSDAR
jgi:malonyl-ACP decarboxylase